MSESENDFEPEVSDEINGVLKGVGQNELADQIREAIGAGPEA